MSIKILFADDEKNMRRLVSDYLKKEDFEVIEAENGREALEKFEENSINLAILDVMMPELDGWTVLRKIRDISNIPVLMLTARSEEYDELFGFELGADDYVTKPFSPKILVARVKKLLNRGVCIKNNELEFEGLKIDKSAHKIYVNGDYKEMTPKEYDMLLYLAENKGKAISRDKLLNKVWGYDYYGDTRTVDTHIKRLRMKLEDKKKYVQTVRGLGYRFEVR